MLGESAGRSRENHPRGTARRRFTVEERRQLSHLRDDPNTWPEHDLVPRNTWVAWSAVVGIGAVASYVDGLSGAVTTVATWIAVELAIATSERS